MSSEHLMFAGIFGLALSACAAPTDTQPGPQEKLGKVSSAQTFYCACSGMPGEWSGSYSSAQQAAEDIGVYCRHGGSCNTGSTGGSTSSGSSGSTGYQGPPGYTDPNAGSGSGTTYGGYGDPGGGGSGSGTGAPTNSSSIPRDGVFRETIDYWHWLGTYHHERSEAGFNDGDAVRFFDGMKEAKNFQNASAWSAVIPMSYAAGLAIFALSKLSDMQVDAIAAKYQATGNDQGIRVVLDVTTDMYTGRVENYLIYNISDGALLGQTSMVYPSMANNTNGSPGQCQYGTFGDVGIAVQSCTNGITACSSGYNCS